jgi:hypothetical protein
VLVIAEKAKNHAISCSIEKFLVPLRCFCLDLRQKWQIICLEFVQMQLIICLDFIGYGTLKRI